MLKTPTRWCENVEACKIVQFGDAAQPMHAKTFKLSSLRSLRMHHVSQRRAHTRRIILQMLMTTYWEPLLVKVTPDVQAVQPIFAAVCFLLRRWVLLLETTNTRFIKAARHIVERILAGIWRRHTRKSIASMAQHSAHT